MFKSGLLQDKIIMITGGGTGLGRAMGERMAELGAKLVLFSRNAEHLAEGASAMRAKGTTVLTLPGDVRKYEEVRRAVERTVSEFGRIDGLINNAAGNIAAPTERISANAFNSVVGIVLHGSFNCTHAVGKQMISQQKGGRILSIVTTYAWTGSAYVVPSACAKAGVLAMTRSLAVEWGKYGIRLNAIAPGPFPTKGAWQRLVPPQVGDIMKSRNPVGRVGRHEELANLAAYLLSEQASYINGECVTIDGGEWLAGAGQFNMLGELSSEDWDALERQARQS